MSLTPNSLPAPLPANLTQTISEAEISSDPWRWWRSQMPISTKWAYFDHAAVAPLPEPSSVAITAFANEAAVDGDTRWPDWAADVEQLRSDFSTFLGCDSTEIALVPNTSFGINVVAEGIDWHPGDNVVIPAGEFPANRFPWLNQERHGVEVRIIGKDDSHEINLDELLNAIDSRTRLVSASWVGYATGHRLDIDRLAHEVHRRGALFFLDAIQGLGIFPIDLRQTPIDFLAADGHKWLLGPEGAGVLMIRKEHLPKLACVPVGWNSVRSALHFSHASFDIRPSASRYEIGSQSMLGMRALRQSLGLFLKVRAYHGDEAIANRVLDLGECLIDGLRARGVDTICHPQRKHRSGIISFAIPGVEPSVFRQLALERSVVVSCRSFGVRASVHAYNDQSDVQRLLDAVNCAQLASQHSTRK